MSARLVAGADDHQGQNMRNSFASRLKRLADEAVEAKRLEVVKAREAEIFARAAVLRAKREAETLARKVAREARRRAENEQRKIAAEAERIARRDESLKQFELKRLRDEKIRQEEADRIKREETERLRLREIALVQICSEIYGALAVAAWDGIEEVAVADESVEFKSQLSSMGILLSQRNQLASSANIALVEMLDAAEQLAFSSSISNKLFLKTRLDALCVQARKSGSIDLASQFSNLANQIASESAEEWNRIGRLHANILDDIEARMTGIAKLKSEIRRTEIAVTEEAKNDALRRKRFEAVVEEIRSHVNDIGSSFQAHLPHGVQAKDLSFEAKAAALRTAYGTFVHGIDFHAFSELEIINLMRRTNGLSAWKSSGEAGSVKFDRWSIDSADNDSWAKKLERLNSDLEGLKAELALMRHHAKEMALGVERVAAKQASDEAFHLSCIRFEAVLAKALEGVSASELRFNGSQYVGSVFARLDEVSPIDNIHLATARQEIRWLVSEVGLDFAGYLDIVLSEMAKEGARGADVVFVNEGAKNKVEIGKVSLVCHMRPALMGLLFSKRGIVVNEKAGCDGRTLFQLSW